MKICLNMIVRNEEDIIAETLRNICSNIPIDTWVICDTGSTDRTKEIITSIFAELRIPGELHQNEWVNFSHNRNLALELCRGKSDLVFFFDADDQISGNVELPPLNADAWRFNLENESRSIRYSRILMVKNDGRAHWRGVVHEFLDVGKSSIANIEGDYVVVSRRKGARSRDPEKYRKDALMLEQAFASPENDDLIPRYAYYCGNSWRDYGEMDRALVWYERRTTLKGWSEEKFLAHIGAALILERQGNRAAALHHLLEGHNVVPDRAECLYHASRILRSQGQFRSALIFAKEGNMIPKPVNNRLFVNNSIYDYWMSYELVFLTARTGGDPRILPQYEQLLSSKAPERIKQSISSL